MNIYLYGGIPEPVGGITHHIFFLAKRLQQEGYEVSVIDINEEANLKKYSHDFILYYFRKDIFKYLFKIRKSINHFHVSNINRISNAFLLLLFITLCKKKNCLLTIHSGGFTEQYHSSGTLRKILINLIFHQCGYVVALNHDIEFLLRKYFPAINIIPAKSFIRDIDHLPVNHIREKTTNNWIFISSGYLTRTYRYEGIVEACEKLIEAKMSIELHLVLYGNTDNEYYNQLQPIFKKKYITVHKSMDHKNFVDLLRESSLYIRNTNHDTYGIAIAEAIDQGTPAIASDVCQRPAGCIVYEKDNEKALLQTIKQVIGCYNCHVSLCNKYAKENDSYKILRAAYSEIMCK